MSLGVGGGDSGYQTRYVTRVISTLVVDLNKLIASKIISYLITGYITPPTMFITSLWVYNSKYITNLITDVYVDGKLYTKLEHPTKILQGIETSLQVITNVAGSSSSSGGGGGGVKNPHKTTGGIKVPVVHVGV